MNIFFTNFKMILLIVASSLLSLNTFAQQQIGNSDFESWDELGNDNERPANWNNIKNGDLCWLCGFGSLQTSWRDTEVRPGSTGNYSARIQSGNAGGIIVNGAITLGRLHAPSPSASAGYNKTTRSNAQYYQTLTDVPDSVVFWAKYSITTSADSARISAIIHDNYDLRDPLDGASQSHVVATAIKSFQTAGDWMRISVPFSYTGPSTDGQYILVTLTSSHVPGQGVNGATVYIDDLELIYNDNEIEIAPIAVQNLFTNQNGSVLTATETPNAASSVTSRQWKYSTTSGGTYTNDLVGETDVTYTPQFASAGTYYVVSETNFSGDIVTSNEVEINVIDFMVTINPNASQTLIENQVGNTLTVNESPIADTREWKYSLTSGSGYVSFTTPEVGTTYTPQFADAGTYYVVVESTKDGFSQVSDEVEINVVEFTAAIDPSATQNLIENQAGSMLTVTESPIADTREWKYSETQGSGYVSFATAEIGTTFTPQFANVGTYYIVVESTIDGITTVSNEVQVNVTEFTNAIYPSALQNLFENQPGTTLTVTESPIANSREWKFTTTSGSNYISFTTAQNGINYTPLFASAGTYYVVCESTIDGITIISNEVEVEVEVSILNVASISPNSIQTLIENQVGTTITVSETPNAADSREWMWSTTSGSGYTSFATVEDGLTYAPQFANAGTYYVICEADFAGDIQISNEVQINVVEFTTVINPSATQNLIENQAGTELTVTESPVADAREWKFTTTSDSDYVSFATVEDGLTYTPQFADAGTYYVVVESTIDGID